MRDKQEGTKLIAGWMDNSSMNVALTGAGISTESGIPDFRSPGGVWARQQPVSFDAFLSDPNSRLEYWRQKSEVHDAITQAEPNPAHQTLAKWESQELLHGIVSQNIDGLHQLAGSQRVLELHGTARWIMCLDCHARYESDPLIEFFRQKGQVPSCNNCGGRLKHATISFGQVLPEAVWGAAKTWCEQCQLLLVMGSSLQVTPAAHLPSLAKESGARVVIINREATPLDEIADVVIRDSLVVALTQIDKYQAG